MLSDIVFGVDSVLVLFAVTREPLIVFTFYRTLVAESPISSYLMQFSEARIGKSHENSADML